MKTVIKNIGVFFLASLVLLASAGVTVSSHFCSSEKKSTVSVFENKGCCGKTKNKCSSSPSSHSQIKKNCCSISINYNKLDVSSVKTEVTKYVFNALNFFHETFSSTLNRIADSFFLNAFKHPPGIFAFGKSLLLSISLLRI
jgi:hypothetical protein